MELENDETTAIESEILEPKPRMVRVVFAFDEPDAGVREPVLFAPIENEICDPVLRTAKTVMAVIDWDREDDGRIINIDAVFASLIEKHPDLFGLSVFARPHVLAQRCRQYQRRLTRYEVSPYEIYARLYNRAHPARHISARRLNRLQIQRALHLFYNRKMPTDYRRQR